jgi:hypothetical protein
MIFSDLKNDLSFFNAVVVAINSKVVGLHPDLRLRLVSPAVKEVYPFKLAARTSLNPKNLSKKKLLGPKNFARLFLSVETCFCAGQRN